MMSDPNLKEFVHRENKTITIRLTEQETVNRINTFRIKGF